MFVNKHSANFTGKKLENSQDKESETFRVLFLYEHEQIGKVSNLRQYTFKKKQQTQLKNKQVKQDILNQWKFKGFLKPQKVQFCDISKLNACNNTKNMFFRGRTHVNFVKIFQGTISWNIS